ncbi:MAG: sigma-70 family RNA polymerase sigma factor [Micromonosporaceae bacterium]
MDPSALARFEETVLPHLDAAYTLARYLLRNDHDAEDAVQDAYLRAVRHFGGYRGGNTRAWLLTIVRRTCYSRLQRHKLDSRMTEFDETVHGEAPPGDDPEAEMLRGALGEALNQAIDALPVEFREVVILRDVQGLAYGEIAEVVGIPVGTVMSRLSRARQRLQRALPVEDYGRS